MPVSGTASRKAEQVIDGSRSSPVSRTSYGPFSVSAQRAVASCLAEVIALLCHGRFLGGYLGDDAEQISTAMNRTKRQTAIR